MTDNRTSTIVGLHHVQLAIPEGSEDTCRAFWRDALGFEEVAKPPVLAGRGGAWFRSGGLEVHLGVEAGFVPATKAHPGILVEDLDQVVGLLEDCGAPVVHDDDFPGMRRVYSADPFGNRLEFLQRRP